MYYGSLYERKLITNVTSSHIGIYTNRGSPISINSLSDNIKPTNRH